MKINLGSGNKRIQGYTNFDILPLENVDMVCDLNKDIPLDDNSVDEVYSSHCLEHIKDLIFVMEEIYRVCKNGAVVEIICPYFKSSGAFKDPTHVNFITENTFYYFDKDVVKRGTLPDYNFKCNFKVKEISYIYPYRKMKYLPFKNLMRKFLWNVVHSIRFKLVVIK
jgi:ubiquinone/menaquinone biosynthesis C-methylase UbiE